MQNGLKLQKLSWGGGNSTITFNVHEKAHV